MDIKLLTPKEIRDFECRAGVPVIPVYDVTGKMHGGVARKEILTAGNEEMARVRYMGHDEKNNKFPKQGDYDFILINKIGYTNSPYLHANKGNMHVPQGIGSPLL